MRRERARASPPRIMAVSPYQGHVGPAAPVACADAGVGGGHDQYAEGRADQLQQGGDGGSESPGANGVNAGGDGNGWICIRILREILLPDIHALTPAGVRATPSLDFGWCLNDKGVPISR